MERKMLFAASVLLFTSVYAQDVPRNPKDPGGGVERQSEPRLPPMAGNPRTQADSTGLAFTPDTAFASILLDRSQAQRIQDMDRRYAAELQELGTTDGNDEAYRELWQRRTKEIQSILTPLQFARWEELNGQTAPVEPAGTPMAVPDR